MDKELLEMKIKKAHFTEKTVSDKLGIAQPTFYRKKIGVSDFTRDEIKTLKELLALTDDDINAIFFSS